jgi:hypothetical protein
MKRAAFAFVRNLLAQSEFFDQRLITRAIAIFQVSEQSTTVINHLEQAATAVVIFHVRLEMRLRKVINIGGEKRNLHFRGAGIVFSATMFFDDGGGLIRGQSHEVSFSFKPLIGEMKRECSMA